MLLATVYLFSRNKLSSCSTPVAAMTSASVYRSWPVTTMVPTRKNSVSAAMMAPQMTSMDSTL